MSDALAVYEINERRLGAQLFSRIKTIKEYTFTSGRISYDFLITTVENKKIIGDIKVRKCLFKKYPDYILQVDKLESLKKQAVKLKQDRIIYVNFFDADIVTNVDFIVFNLSARIERWKKHPPKIKKMMMNNETWKSTEYKVLKDVILLQFDETIDIKGTFSLN